MKELKDESIVANGKNYTLLKELRAYQEEIQNKIDSSYDNNVFIMTKFRDYNEKISQEIIEALKKEGFNGVRADMADWNITGDSILNPLAVLYCCKYGIALFDEPIDNQDYGPNVAYELGIMHYQHKNCLILIHESISNKKPFDLLGKIHAQYKDGLEIGDIIKDWLTKIKYSSPESLQNKGTSYKWSKIHNYLEIGYSMIMIITNQKDLVEVTKWKIYMKDLCKNMGIDENYINHIEQEGARSFGYKILSHANCNNEEEYLNFFRISFYFCTMASNIYNKSQFSIPTELENAIISCSLPKELIDIYEGLKKEFSYFTNGDELAALNAFLHFIDKIREHIRIKLKDQ